MSSIRLGAAAAARDGFEVQDWASAEDMRRLSSGSVTGDVILAEGAGVSFAPNPAWELQRNANALVVGGTGAGKTRSVVLPNLINHLDATYVVTDTKGELARATRAGFEADGYEVLVLDPVRPDRSCHFNPLGYVRGENDVHVVCEMLLDMMNPERGSAHRSGDPFWEQASALLLEALVGICLALEQVDGKYAPGWEGGREPRYLNVANVFRLAALIKADGEGRAQPPCPMDRLVAMLCEGRIPANVLDSGRERTFAPMAGCFGVTQYRAFRAAAERTLRSILITFHANTYKLKTPEMQELFSSDDLDLDGLDSRRRVVFLSMSDNDSANAFVGAMALKLMVNRTLLKADDSPGGRLARPVVFVCDEFANIGAVRDFERIVSITRSRNISFLLCVQSTGQLEHAYGRERARVIMDNCDSLVFLGSGSTWETSDYFSRLCGTKVLGHRLAGLEGTEDEVTGQLMGADEVARLPRQECIVKVSGMRPFRARKYDVLAHPNAARFLELADAPAATGEGRGEDGPEHAV